MAGAVKGMKWRHGLVAASILSVGGLGALGLLGSPKLPERYDSWQTVIAPAGDNAVQVRLTIDQDFGSADRHGPELFIDNDFGEPQGVRARSDDAPDDVSTLNLGSRTRVRIGSPSQTVSGQHRYTVSYTLPDARLDEARAAFDILAGDSLARDHVEVVLSGFQLDDPRCFVGVVGSTDRCDLVSDGALHRAVVDDLPKLRGITVDGIVRGLVTPSQVAQPALPERRAGRSALGGGLAFTALGTAAALPVYLWRRWRGSNLVYAGGSTEAAHGPASGAVADARVRRVSDGALFDLATTEFSPPQGIAPWEAGVLLTETLDEQAVVWYLSGLAGRDAITLAQSGRQLEIARGRAFASLPADEQQVLDDIFSVRHPYRTGTYDTVFASAWGTIAARQRARINASGWWVRGGPTSNPVLGMILAVILVPTIVAILVPVALVGAFRPLAVAIPVAVLLPALTAWLCYRRFRAARSAAGSALTLQAESFRRFLEASEGRHVEWAWSRGLLREYSSWAVALGAAGAWSRALGAANLPDPERLASASPMLAVQHGPSLHSSHVAPSQSSSDGGSSWSSSDFSGGGSVGGGGGGVSGGSW